MYEGANLPLPRKKIIGQPTTTIWTNLVDLESQMLYTKIQPEIFLVQAI